MLPNSGPCSTRVWFDDYVERDPTRIAAKYGSELMVPSPAEKVGAAANVRDGIWPVNGLRHPPAGTTCGWYLWAGEEFSEDPDFFVPLHVTHLPDWCPAAMPYLGLAPGWRFLIAPGYEDVWFDPSLLRDR